MTSSSSSESTSSSSSSSSTSSDSSSSSNSSGSRKKMVRHKRKSSFKKPHINDREDSSDSSEESENSKKATVKKINRSKTSCASGLDSLKKAAVQSRNRSSEKRPRTRHEENRRKRNRESDDSRVDGRRDHKKSKKHKPEDVEKHSSLSGIDEKSKRSAKGKSVNYTAARLDSKSSVRSPPSERKAPDVPSQAPPARKPILDTLATKTGGAYIPPARLRMMQNEIQDKTSAAYQRLSWEALKKSITGLINKVSASNLSIIVEELLQENIVRGRGVLCRALIQAQSYSPGFTNVYAALAAIVNSRFPKIGELLLNRLLLQLRKSIKRNNKSSCMASCKFLAHLINQQVSHEVVGLQLLCMLLAGAKNITDESEEGAKSRNCSIELVVAFLKECGAKLNEMSPAGMMGINTSLRHILHDGKLDARYQYMLDVYFSLQKDNFKDNPPIVSELDKVEDDEQFTHVIELDAKLDAQDILDVFKFDPEYTINESKYKEIKDSFFGNEDDSAHSGSESESDSEEDSDKIPEQQGQIVDMTDANLTAFRRKVYLAIQSSLTVDEACHKLLKGEVKEGWEEELCNMVVDCCAQKRNYEKFYSLMASRLCQLNAIYRESYEKIFVQAYETCHRLETEKLRNVCKLFAYLMASDSISWEVFSTVHLNIDQTTSSSRVFLKFMFEELVFLMEFVKVSERLRDPTLSHAFEGLLPRDNPAHTRFAINFFTSIGMGGLTDDLRQFLKLQGS